MLATGLKSGIIKVWDIRTQTVATTVSKYEGGARGDVTKLAFSNKGIYFAASFSKGNTSTVFDLRKIDSVFFDIAHDSPVTSVSFDHSGTNLLTCAGKGVRVYSGKQWDEVVLNAGEVHDSVVNVAR